MKTKKRNICTAWLAIAFCVCLLLSVLLVLPKKSAKADESDFQMTKAEVRLDENEGIRFVAHLGADAYEENCEYYVMIIPYDYLEEYGLSFGVDYYDELINEYAIAKEELVIMQSYPVLQETGDYTVSGSIKNVKYQNSNRKFFGVAYKQKQNGERVYAKANENAVQSLAGVATAALNKENAEYTEKEQTALNGMIRRAFNQLSGKAENKQGNVVFQMSALSATVSKGGELQLSVPHAKTLGFDVVWKSEDESKATVDENGLVRALTFEGICKIQASVYGQTCVCVVAFRPTMAENVLEDYATSASKYNMSASNCASGSAGEWLAEFEGAQGVGKCTYWKATNAMALRFNKSVEELRALQFDQITIRLWMDYEKVEQNGDIKRTHALRIGSKHEVIPTKEWYDFTVTKNEMISSCAGNTASEKYESFCQTFSNGGTGRFLMSFHDGQNSIPVYIDYITFGYVEIEEKTAPTTAGETFALPTAKLMAGNSVLSENYAVSVRVGETEIPVQNNAITVQKGTTTVEYTFAFDGISYKKTWTFDVG